MLSRFTKNGVFAQWIILFVTLGGIGFAQSDLGQKKGITLGDSFDRGEIDSVNLRNGNLVS